MSQRSYQTKRPYSEVDSENDSPTRASQRSRRPTAKLQQSILEFGRRPSSQSLLRRVTARSPTPQSIEPSTQEPSTREQTPESLSEAVQKEKVRKKKPRKNQISAHRRVEIEVDLTRLDGEYRERLRSKSAFGSAPISWIYLHGIELEKRGEKGWNKQWLCKHCYDSGTVKIFAADSTWSPSRHLEGTHGIYSPGTPRPAALDRLDSYLEEVHPLRAERWRVDFLNWIVHDNITFEQAASQHLRKVILGGGSDVARLLPCARTVRSWLITTYNERISDVKKSLAGARSRINLSFDAWSSPNHRSLLGIVAHWIDEQCMLKTALLGLPPLEGHHGHEIADAVLPVIKTFAIENKLGAFQTDNASNNDTAL
jgi:hypothetical protein